jgi:hypothetical protein
MTLPDRRLDHVNGWLQAATVVFVSGPRDKSVGHGCLDDENGRRWQNGGVALGILGEVANGRMEPAAEHDEVGNRRNGVGGWGTHPDTRGELGEVAEVV